MVALPGNYSPASIALRVIEARKPPLHDKTVVLEEASWIDINGLEWNMTGFLILDILFKIQ
jgi:hypothetical protein